MKYIENKKTRKKIAKEIVKKVIENNDVIVTETLNIKEMTKNVLKINWL